MVAADGNGVPLHTEVASASTYEGYLADQPASWQNKRSMGFP
jgi:hypothetical protein